MKVLTILSGGAAQGLVKSLSAAFEARSGWRIDGEFGAVGTMADKLRAGAAADLVILTDAIVEALEREGVVVAGSATPIGLVETAVAARNGDPVPAIDDADHLRTAFLAADALFVPDMQSSTAGRHVAAVLDRLGIAAQMRSRLQESPNGATAMRKLADSAFARPLGCTQATEIIATPGLTLVGPLPPQCALATVYTAAVLRWAADPAIARTLIDLLTAPSNADVRARAGFVARA